MPTPAQVEDALCRSGAGKNCPADKAASAPPVDNAKFFKAPTEAEKEKRKAGPPKEMLDRQKKYAKGGSIDGCAQRGHTRATRSRR